MTEGVCMATLPGADWAELALGKGAPAVLVDVITR